MNLVIDILPEFGSFCADGERAAEFRFRRIDPFVDIANSIVLNFAGVRNMNSSFANALIANLVTQHSAEVLKKLKFSNCNQTIQLLVVAAIELGTTRERPTVSK